MRVFAELYCLKGELQEEHGGVGQDVEHVVVLYCYFYIFVSVCEVPLDFVHVCLVEVVMGHEVHLEVDEPEELFFLHQDLFSGYGFVSYFLRDDL